MVRRSPWSRVNTAATLVAACAGARPTARARPASAHLATWGSWEITRRNLDRLFPDAKKYLQKRYTFDDAQVAEIEKFLGFKLYPEDRTPVFFVAMGEADGKERLLGVALFIDPRIEPRVVGGQVVRLEVGVAVDGAGKIGRVLLYDYKGDARLGAAEFLDQLKGRTLQSRFDVARAGAAAGDAIRPVPREEGESQLVANAGREALFLMKLALGKKG
jgi:hypothetical protein